MLFRWPFRIHLARPAIHNRWYRLQFDVLEDRVLLSTTWVNQGPGPITNAFPNAPAEVGAVQAIAADPTNPNRVFAATTDGGIWETTNATSGPHWIPLTDSQPTLGTGAIIFRPSPTGGLAVDANTVYAGTGTYSSGLLPTGTHGVAGMGVLKTIDGGATWVLEGQSTFQNKTIRTIAISPGQTPDSDIVLVGTGSAFQFDTGSGIFRSTDGGNSWKKVTLLSFPIGSGTVSSIVRDPSDATNQTFFAASPMNGMFKSTDAGATWTAVNTGIVSNDVGASSNVQLSIQFMNGLSTIFAGFVTGGIGGAVLSGVYSSPTSTVNWTPLGVPNDGVNTGSQSGINPGRQGYNNFAIVADPTQPGVVFVSGDVQPLPGGQRPEGINYPGGRHARWNGSQWEFIDGTGVNGPGSNGTDTHADSRAMVFDAAGNLLEADDGGIYRLAAPDDESSNTQRRWDPIVGDMQNTEFYTVSYDDLNNILFGGSQDNGTPQQITANSTPYAEQLTGDGAASAVSSSPTQSIHYFSNPGLQNFIRNTYDNHNNPISTFQRVNLGPNLQPGGLGGNPVLATTPLDPNRLLLGFGNVYESTQMGDNVNLVLNTGGSSVQALVIGGFFLGVPNPDVAWAGTADGKVYFRLASGPFNLLPEQGYTGGPVMGITMDPGNPFRAWVADANGQVWFSNPAGSTGFTNVTNNLPNLDGGKIFSITIVDPTPTQSSGDEIVYVGTTNGVYQAVNPVDNTAVWSRVGTNLPNVPILTLQFDYKNNLLVAGSYGRGAWTLSQPAGPQIGLFPVKGPDEIGVGRGDPTFALDAKGTGSWQGTAGGDLVEQFGAPGDIPIAGDWTGTGHAHIGVFRNMGAYGEFILDIKDTGVYDPAIDPTYIFGSGTDRPVVGDWNGDGTDKIGVFQNVNGVGQFVLDYFGDHQYIAGRAQVISNFGTGSDTPVVGDWEGDGTDKVGVFRLANGQGVFSLDLNGSGGYQPGVDDFYMNLIVNAANLPPVRVLPLAGDWDGSGLDKLGLFLDYGPGQENDFALSLQSLVTLRTQVPVADHRLGSGDVTDLFGASGDVPLLGHW